MIPTFIYWLIVLVILIIFVIVIFKLLGIILAIAGMGLVTGDYTPAAAVIQPYYSLLLHN